MSTYFRTIQNIWIMNEIVDRKGSFFTPFFPIYFAFLLYALVKLWIQVHQLIQSKPISFDIFQFLIIVIGIPFLFTKGGISFNFSEKSITKYVDLFNYRIWSKKTLLPETTSFVQIVKKLYKERLYGSSTAYFTIKNIRYAVYLVDSIRKKYDLILIANKKNSYDYGEILAEMYGTKLNIKI